ncbi:zinc finger homeobox protein 3-like isoform X1 [Limulus polyphemus]|uniref:Zinc finger homeobox protein 3-like isoform X1 n=1 Tax=Limulus polyphemus TaxID=6850 RepID=A0ABM1S1Z2_LIMPO|nr:zinc finger homeobox protein 3-like isoform X1 [Limulus polyphemus]XP_022237645.1 zinc finger homeobox protein 3-like isoform X1 [Limulus polyphemus]XP_022237646.1 zinc finger homeobox protein 3-like isoform X1 [Limulus polyphemus]XP_022237647.1 zinc finger homeobox protein 3-like isoform X1 [Limulus polyphemus]
MESDEPDVIMDTGQSEYKKIPVTSKAKSLNSESVSVFSGSLGPKDSLGSMTPQDNPPNPVDQQRAEELSKETNLAPCTKLVEFNSCESCGQKLSSTLNHHHCDPQEPRDEDAAQVSGREITEVATELSDSEVETFTGKIVYNPDGSAFIIEGESEFSDEECSLDLPQQEGSIVDSREMSPQQYRVFPQVVNAFHISKNRALYSALYGQAYSFLQENKKVPEVPIMHCYRVFTLREKYETNCNDKNENFGPDERTSNVSKGKIPSLEYSSIPVKPILMCFICKLSFAYAKSFVAHAGGEHNIALLEEERQILSQKNISAIIQGVGKEKEPLLSFLEPIPSKAAEVNETPHFQRSFYDQAAHSSYSSSSAASSAVSSLLSIVNSAVSSVICQSINSSVTTTLVPACLNPVASVRDIKESVIDPTTKQNNQGNSSDYLKTSEESLAPELEDLANIEKLAKAAAAAAEAKSFSEVDIPSYRDQNRRNFQTENRREQNVDIHDSPSPTLSHLRVTSADRPTSSSSGGSISPGACSSPKVSISPNSCLATSHSPGLGIGNMMGICSQHPDGKTNGVECPKCDVILGSSRSLGGHMTMMHSRNSCKTLKCPKCNWHYKYQETLEIHMKEKHPENEMSCIYCITNQPHPRLTRGETYTCGYKPYRCEVCNYSTTTKGNLSIHMQSDKHINNVQELQNGNISSEHIVQPQPLSNAHVQEQPKKGPSPNKPKATWRCDVCNYETNVARNLRIHMTSEKHTHNMMVLQQNVKHMQHLTALQQAQALDPMFQFHPGLLLPHDNQLQPEAALADMYYNHALLMMASQQQQQQRAMAVAAAATSGPGKSPPGIPPLTSNATPTVDMEHPDPTLVPDMPYDDDSKMFQCCICSLFSTDTVEGLNYHLQQDRSREREDEVLMVVSGNFVCKLCSYKTNLKANFMLHSKTDKHLQRLQHVNHIKEGGPRNDWKLKYINMSNPVQVRCNACDYYTNSVHKLQIHTNSQRHEGCARLFLHLQLSKASTNSESSFYHCVLCNFSTNTKQKLIQHVSSLEHVKHESMRQMQRSADDHGREDSFKDILMVKVPSGNSKSELGSETSPKLKEHVENEAHKSEDHCEQSKEDRNDSSALKQVLLDQTKNATVPSTSEDSSKVRHQVYTCPFCNYTSSNEVRIQMHVVTQHSQKPASLNCPLCQDNFVEWTELEKHVVDTHNVNKEGVKRLLALVDQSAFEDMPKTAIQNEDCIESKGNNSEDDSDSQEISYAEESAAEELACPVCSKTFSNVDDLFLHQNEKGHIEIKQTPRESGYMCWWKGCKQCFPSSQTLQLHFKEIHAKIPQLAVSDRHVYKYRCSQCSLAFRTLDKLQLHSQYHVIRAATKCVLCDRSFRSIQALKKHVETSHIDMTNEEMEQYKASLANNPLLTNHGSGPGVLDPQTTELMKKDNNRDIAESFEELMDTSIPGDDVSDQPNNSEGNTEDGNDPTTNLVDDSSKEQFFEDYINSQAVAEDSYCDPTRKYKCHRCKVAFTRQSYLTSHNKTLLHRKGEKMSYPMEKYLDPNRPYKCDVCKESFTQKNILLVHYNSVSHLHKLKQSMKENSTGAVTTVSTAPTTSTTKSSSNCPSPSSTSSNSESDKKPYKCNICKVAYNQGSTLDIHVKSVLHQTRASKLHELAITGQIDLSIPLIEKPESTHAQEAQPKDFNDSSNNLKLETETRVTTSTLTSVPAPQPSKQNELLQVPHCIAPVSGTVTKSSASSQLPFQVPPDPSSVQQALSLASHLAQSPVLTPTGVSLLGTYTCQRCHQPCISQEALLQHQQLCCFFGQPSSSLFGVGPPGIPSNALTGLSQSQIPTQMTHLDISCGQHRPDLGYPKFEHVSSSHTESNVERLSFPSQVNDETSVRMSPQMLRPKCPYPRSKPLMYKHLLESYGFDIVMQFNEFSKKKVKKDTEKIDDEGEKEERSYKKDNSDEGGKNDDKKGMNINFLPEINKSVCELCQREFSSVWVLKSHKEEYHKKVVPFNLLETFVEEYRRHYEKRQSQTEDTGSISDATPTPISTPDSIGQVQKESCPSMNLSLSVATTQPSPVTTMAGQHNDSFNANQMAAQFQFNQLLMSMGLGMGLPVGMGMPFTAMNMHPPMIPVMMPPPVDPFMASAFNHPMLAGSMEPNYFASQQKLLQQQPQQLSQSQQQKRARTRINDDQLKVLRTYFDINNSPTEEQLVEMSEKSGLTVKVIKHWFRNTLFKERQRNKDSPYNFSNPPSTYLNLEEYEKTGEAKILSMNEPDCQSDFNNTDHTETRQENELTTPKKSIILFDKDNMNSCEPQMPEVAINDKDTSNQCGDKGGSILDAYPTLVSRNSELSREPALYSDSYNSQNDILKQKDSTDDSADYSSGSVNFSVATTSTSFGHKGLPKNDLAKSTLSPNSMSSRSSGSGKRANRTRFTDYQVKILQEFFETNAYPKDDNLDYLSKLLNLSPRIIVVWFQNARQKARKMYENQPPVTNEDENSVRFQRTPGLNYQCKKCLQVFQRYYELIKHQKSICFKDENPVVTQMKNSPEETESRSRPVLPTSNQGINPSPEQSKATCQNGTYRCDKCSLAFPRFDLWREHQIVHIMNPNLFTNFSSNSSFGMLQYEAQQGTMPSMKRKLSEDEESKESTDQPRDKRLRTTILPEQLDFLYQKYQIESNPSRKMLETIAREVGLKKRVVQVWFQNTRARERKGQFRAHQQVIHKRCPFCRALFKARSALESHLATRHADQYTKGEINVDTLPDGDTDSEAANSAEDEGKGNSSNFPGLFAPSSPVPGYSPSAMDSANKNIDEEHTNKYEDDLSLLNRYTKESSGPTDLSVKPQLPRTSETKDGPLDLSKPVKINVEADKPIDPIPTNLSDRSFDDSSFRLKMADDVRSETHSESTDREGEDLSHESNPTSPATQSQLQSSRSTANSGKRFRTQMSTLQITIMKSIFKDYKTPSMAECEQLGREIGLAKRVVQVWFQNARAKEKKSILAFTKTFGQEMETKNTAEECKICTFKYDPKYSTSFQDHLFSRKHIENLKNQIEGQKKLKDSQETSPLSTSGGGNPLSQLMQQEKLETSSSSVRCSTSTISTSGQQNLMQQLQMMELQQMAGLGVPGLHHSPVLGLSLNQDTSSPSTEDNVNSPFSERTSMGKGNIAGSSTSLGLSNTSIKPIDDDTKDTVVPVPSAVSTHSSTPVAQQMDFSVSPSDGSGLFPYMYSGVPGYYPGMPGNLIPPSMYNTGGSAGGLFYDANMYSTPLSLLQLPSQALVDVTQKLSQPGNSITRFSQDGKTLVDLKGSSQDTDFQQVAEIDIDVGFMCKNCQMVYPSEVLCLNHQRATCFGAAKGDIQAILRLVQIHFECRVCCERFLTILNFKFHCDMDHHVRRVQKLQRGASSSCDLGTSMSNQISAAQNITTPNNHLPNNNTSQIMPSTSSSPILPGFSVAAATNQHCSLTSSISQSTGISTSRGRNVGPQPLPDKRKGLPEIVPSLPFPGVPSDFRHELDSALSFSMGFEAMVMRNGMDSSTFDIAVSDHMSPTSKRGICFSGDPTLSPEAKRL